MKLHGPRLSLRGYARIVRALIDEPGHALALCARLDIHRITMRAILRRMVDLRIAYVCDWVRPAKAGPRMPVYAFGLDFPSVPRPLTRKGRHEWGQGGTLKPTIELTTFAHFLRALQEPKSVRELCEATGMHRNSVQALLRYMNRTLGLAFIADWDEHGYFNGVFVPQYQFGNYLKNRPKPWVAKRVPVSSWQAKKAKREQQAILTALTGQQAFPSARRGATLPASIERQAA